MHEIVAYRIQLLKETSGEKSCAGHKYIQTIAGNIINIIYFIYLTQQWITEILNPLL